MTTVIRIRADTYLGAGVSKGHTSASKELLDACSKFVGARLYPHTYYIHT